LGVLYFLIKLSPNIKILQIGLHIFFIFFFWAMLLNKFKKPFFSLILSIILETWTS